MQELAHQRQARRRRHLDDDHTVRQHAVERGHFLEAVSYTHLDVYKRQGFAVSAGKSGADLPAYLPAGCWERYLSTYADAEPGHVWAAVFAAAPLFLAAAHQTAEARCV